MIYNFLEFSLNTVTKELSVKGKPLETTKQHYDLLLLFLENPDSVFSKDDLIDKVWKGRYVTENTIDQSISKLRKTLTSEQRETHIKTIYGHGFKFVPKVTCVDQKQQANQARNKFLYLVPILLILIGVLVFNNNRNIVGKSPESLLLIISDVNATSDDVRLNQAFVTFFDQLIRFSNVSKLKDIDNKPDYQSREQYINNQLAISPDLKVVSTHLSLEDKIYKVKLSIADKYKLLQTKIFSDENLGKAMKQASQWIANEVHNVNSIASIDSLIPEDTHVVELYMHGLASHAKGEIDKASNFFELCIQEKPDFYLARLRLAAVLSDQGHQEKSLAMLDTLSAASVYPRIEIEAENLRADIYDTQGKFEQARDIYLDLLSKFAEHDVHQLNAVRYNLSYTYTVLTEYEKAIAELNKIESSTNKLKDPELLANVYHKKSSILQKLGHTKLAKQTAEQALAMFSTLQDLLGEAKTYASLARISTHQSKYDESIQYLQESLLINEKLGYKLGIGATLNELIYVLMVQGQFTKAWQANQKMQSIALEIDYQAMLQIAKQYAVDITRTQNKFLQAEIYLQEHLQLAQASNNKRALLKNKLLALDLLLDQKETDSILSLIEDVNKHIEATGEIRLQPRINKHLARYYFLINNTEQALALLISSKNLAQETDDGETIVEVNNLLAEHYISNNQAQKALAILEESATFNPLPYPYLLLKSKANEKLGNILQALDLVNECKAGSNELWTLTDERYLEQLENKVNSPNKQE